MARDRLERFSARLERLPTPELRMLGARPIDAAAHVRARAEAVAAAEDAGLGELADGAQAAFSAWAAGWLGDRYSEPTFMGLPWQQDALRPADRALVLETLRDAVLAIVVGDLVPEATADELLGPFAGLVAGER